MCNLASYLYRFATVVRTAVARIIRGSTFASVREFTTTVALAVLVIFAGLLAP